MSLEELEKLRIKARNQSLFGIIGSILLGILLAVLTTMPAIAFFGFVAGVIVTTIISGKSKIEYTLAFKDAYVLKSLQQVFDNLEYHPEMGLDYSVIANTEMMYMGDRYTSNDYISGSYKNINVVQADVHIEEEETTTDSDGNTSTYWVTLFLGRWMIFDFNKTFKANVQVCQKGFGNNRVNTLFSKTKYQKVSMEDQDFNNHYRTYAQNEHDAFYILTPSLMEKIKSVTSKVDGKLLLCFIDNKLHVGLQNGKDSFEPSIWKKINEAEVLESISKDIKLITQFVDELNLDNDLFRGEV